MKNIDVEIYISQMITFFEKNPKDFIDLVGNIEKEIFYNKMKERSLKNVKEKKDLILTKEQIIDIVIELQDPNLNEKKDITLVNLKNMTLDKYSNKQFNYDTFDLTNSSNSTVSNTNLSFCLALLSKIMLISSRIKIKQRLLRNS